MQGDQPATSKLWNVYYPEGRQLLDTLETHVTPDCREEALLALIVAALGRLIK